MVVQATNTGSDVASTQFDLAAALASMMLALPSGGLPLLSGERSMSCSKLEPRSSANIFSVDWEVVTCPAELVAKSGCSVTGYNAANASSTPSSSVKAPAAPIITPKSSTSAIPVKESATIVTPVNKPGSTTKSISQAPTSASSTTQTSTTRTFTTPSSSSSKTTPLHPHWAPHRKVSYDARKHEEEADDECEA
ncbi:hypothetical protein ABVK25_009956 [Lepraria finkii]|uniref:Uncharacterized protein n=1 Tax=Lepraria finkii TaxID=1340010 RepID=A0ABR4B1W3_9LECA